jgi:hypothetical protein
MRMGVDSREWGRRAGSRRRGAYLQILASVLSVFIGGGYDQAGPDALARVRPASAVVAGQCAEAGAIFDSLSSAWPTDRQAGGTLAGC